MTKKDYIIIAQALKQAYKDCDKQLIGLARSQEKQIALTLGLSFIEYNPKFNSDKFISIIFN